MADNVKIAAATSGSTYIRTKEISAGIHASVVIPADSAGNLYTPNSITQNVQLSTNNNSSSTLGAGLSTTFTGESTLNCSGLQINFEADTPFTIYVQQSQDNVTYLIEDSFEYVANTGFSTTVQATASYFRVKLTNHGSGTGTYKLQSVLCPIVEALPRALDEHGYLKSGIKSIQDENGNKAQFSMSNDLKVCEPYRLIGATFGSASDTSFWTLSNSGTSSGASVALDVATLTSGSSNGGYGQVTSVRTARFVAYHPHVCRMNARVTATAVTNCTRRWGAFTVSTTTPQDGFYFELSSAGALSVVTCYAGTPTAVASGSFNGASPTYTLNTSVHKFDIMYNNTKALFYIDNELIHTVSATTARLSSNPHLNATATCINGTSASSGVLEMWSLGVYRLGRSNTAPAYKYSSGTTAGVSCKTGPGKLHSLVISGISNGSVVTLYDNSSATGTVLWSSGTMVVSTNVNPHVLSISPPEGWPFYTGLAYSVTTAAANVAVGYE